jgi:signal transduction histidine kinase/DNA-binding response OmpR family regulator/HPt (histidine-containing phosphotransfer) domain-containing protein
MKLPPSTARRLAAFMAFLALIVLQAAPAWAAPLLLDSRHLKVEAWPAVTVLSDPDGSMTAAQALAASSRFTAPQSAYATLGVRKDVVWLRIPIKLAADASPEWVIGIDYAVLNRVDVYVSDAGDVGSIKRVAVLGNLQAPPPGAPHPRTPASVLHLQPGAEQTVLLRVENIGAMILPISFSSPAVYHAGALAEQMLQGLLTGLSLCLLLYGLAQWVNLREPLFAKFALLIGGTTLFSVEFFGIGSQYLWPGSAWMTHHSGGLFALMASCGAYLFVEQALARPGMDRTFRLLMRSGAALTVITALAYSSDVIGVDTLVAIVSTLGIMPMLLGLPGAFMRARRGDMVGSYFLAGWAVSFISSVILSQMINGAIGANFWTMHALQFGNIFDMLVFMRILGLRTKAMQSAMIRAEAATRMKSEFLANMSHEIRTPLNAVIGMSRLALMAEPNPRVRNYVGKIQGAGEHLLSIINDILDFSRIEAGKLALESVPFDLNDMLEHLSSLTAVKTDAKRVELVFHVARGVPARLVGDPLRLGQVLINLTGNAVKFTERGEIVVSVDVANQDDAGVTLRFSVSDTGIGMNEQQLARLFQSFSQADNSITRRYGGTGLGLSISRQLVELMGGAIRVSSTPGVGSRFSFTVKLGIADAASAPVPLPAAALQQVRVMVVDDSATARDALVEMLTSLGVTAHAASSGEQSLAMLARAVDAGQPYHVVLMDYMMPGWDGVETIRRIHADQRFPTPPAILMVTVCTREAVLQQEGELPLSGFLTKPVGPALLYHSLLQVLQPELYPEHAASGHSSGDGDVDGLAAGTGTRGAGMGIRDLSRLDGARVLLVEDNANNREVAVDFLSAARIRIDIAMHGGEAVQMVQQEDYDLVLMDIQMQEVDGFTATRRIRAIERLRELPIVAMTAHAMTGDREKSLAAGMNDHVVKPIDPELLFRCLLKWVPAARLAGREIPPAALDAAGHAAATSHAASADQASATRQPAAAGHTPAPDHTAQSGQAALPTLSAPAAPTAPAPLPVIRGIDWQVALENVDHQRHRLDRRLRGFLHEYGSAPQAMRDALANGNHVALQSLAHNLRPSAAYIGAADLSALANIVEQELRAGRRERIAVPARELAAALDAVLAGLSGVGIAPPAIRYDAAEVSRLVKQLEAYLRSDDARAEDALQELQERLSASGHDITLAAIQHAVDDIEYAAALAPLAALSAALALNQEERA